MALGNKGFADLIGVTGDTPRRAEARLPPRTGILGTRENRLAELASGAMVTRVHEWIAPASCRIWSGHNRDYAALSESSCADLIESFRAQGRQEVPAIVRRITGDPQFQYEVICGARRHWTATWMRAHDYPDFRFLIEPRELTDEEAFRLADLENRHRKDLSDYERATDYARAVDLYYAGSQQRMAERLDVTKSWLSRYLDLARLPAEILESFGSPHVLGISHAATLGPLLRTPATRDRMLEAAVLLAAEQTLLAQRGAPLLATSSVVRRLTEAAVTKALKQDVKEMTIRGEDGVIVARGKRVRGGPLLISLPIVGSRNRPALLAAITAILDQIAGKAET